MTELLLTNKDVSEKATAPARGWVRWLLLAIFVGSIAFLMFKNVPFLAAWRAARLKTVDAIRHL